MLDKMTFSAYLTPKQEQHVIDQLRLIKCVKDKAVYWADSPYAQLTGMHCTIKGHKMKLSFSVHKQWENAQSGHLDNSGSCTMSQALSVITYLFAPDGLDIPLNRLRVRYFELGLSFQMAHDPIMYIRQMLSVGMDKNREMFIDYLYERDRQKVTSKTRFVRKVGKVYDKSFEAEDRGRDVPPRILRVETQYKRMNIPLLELLEPATLGKFVTTFYNDWSAVTWQRQVVGGKGAKESQLAKAREIIADGVDVYLYRHRQQWQSGQISDKAWRTFREFAQTWEDNKHRYHLERGPLEAEYDDKFHNAFVYAQS